MIPYIDRLPPNVTGDPRVDTAQMAVYLRYLTDRLNFIIAAINKTQEANNNNGD